MEARDGSRATHGLSWVVPSVTVVFSGITGWLVGLILYRFFAGRFFRHPASSGDATAVGMWVSIAVAICLPFAYLPLIAWLHRRYVRDWLRSAVGFACGAALAPLPAAAVVLMWSSRPFAAFFSPEYLVMLVWTAAIGGFFVAGAAFHARFWIRM